MNLETYRDKVFRKNPELCHFLSDRASFVFVICAFLAAIYGCSNSHSEPSTFIVVPNSDLTQLSEDGKVLTHWNDSFARASVARLKYKQFTFNLNSEREQLRKKIEQLKLGDLLARVMETNPIVTLLQDGRVLVSGGMTKDKFQSPISSVLILDPKTKTVDKLGDLNFPRYDHTVLQLRDGRVIFIGGETTKAYADDSEHGNYTSSVEELDLNSGLFTIIGKIVAARASVIAELVGDNDILVVGGWHENGIGDMRWWTLAELFRVPGKEGFTQNVKSSARRSGSPVQQ